MTLTSGRRLWPVLGAIFIHWMAVYGPGLFRPSLVDDIDSAHAEAGREILVRHDWVTLHENGIRYLEEAPLPYWGVAASFHLFGISEFAARFTRGIDAAVAGRQQANAAEKVRIDENGAGIVS
jgi:4-amino-4-deoxy-L-arabinose transferase-like glycosyltransferase